MIALRALGKAEIITPTDRLTPSQEILFAAALYLFLERAKPVSRMTMADVLWPGTVDSARQHRLRQTIFQLKHAGIPLEATRETVLLPPSERESDLDVLFIHGAGDIGSVESLQFLPGYAPTFSSEFAHWLDIKRSEVSTATSRLLINDIRRARSRGDWLRVERLAFKCMEVDPFNEEAVLARAEASAMRGAKREAVTILDQYVADLGVASGEIKLPANLMRKRISERVPEAAFSSRTEGIFVGRESDMTLLTALLDDARSGKGRCCLLWGDAGIGKSRLAAELGKFGELQGVQVRRVACRRGDAQRPLSVFVEAVPQLREMRGALGCSPDTMADLQRLTQFDVGSPTRPAMELDPQSIFELIRLAIFDLIDAVSEEQCLMLVVEDVHWLDAASARILGQLADWAVKKQLLLLFTSRLRENPLLEACTRAGLVTHHIRPLSNEAATELLREMFDATNEKADDEFLAWSRTVGDGNPFFLHELVKQWLETKQRHVIPPSITTVIRERFSRLSSEGTQLLQACSILGENSTLPRVEKMLQQEPYMLLGALNELSKASMLSAERKAIAGSKDFKLAAKHDLISMVALEELDAHAAAFLHRRAGEVLEAELGENAQDTSLLWACAQHWQKAGETDKAYHLALTCGAQLASVGLAAEAADAFDRSKKYCTTAEDLTTSIALEATALERAQLWTRLRATLSAARASGDIPAAHDDFDLAELTALWRTSTNNADTLRHAMQCIHSDVADVRHKTAAACIALKIASNEGTWDLMDSIYLAVRPLTLAIGDDDLLRVEFEMIYQTMRGRIEDALSITDRLNRAVVSTRNINHVVRTLSNSSDIFRLAGQFDRAEAVLRQAIELAISNRCLALARTPQTQLVWVNLEAGEVATARHNMDELLRNRAAQEDPVARVKEIIVEARLALEESGAETARALCARLHTELDQLPKPRRALTVAVLVQFAMKENEDPAQIIPLLGSLEASHLEFRSTGWHDYEAITLYEGLRYIGEAPRAEKLFSEYLNTFRREKAGIKIKMFAESSFDPLA